MPWSLTIVSLTGDAMTENGQTAVAWEMLSSVVAMRAKARESKLPKLLSSLHGVEIELARIIAGTNSENTQENEAKNNARSRTAVLSAATGQLNGFGDYSDLDLDPEPIVRSRSSRRGGGSGADKQLKNYARRYLAISEQLKDLVARGESVAFEDPFALEAGDDWEANSDALLSEQHDLSFTIANLQATTMEGLTDKAAVLDDLIEENTDDPVQILARSLAQDIIAMGQRKKLSR